MAVGRGRAVLQRGAWLWRGFSCACYARCVRTAAGGGDGFSMLRILLVRVFTAGGCGGDKPQLFVCF